MIPQNNARTGIETTPYASKTFYINFEKNQIQGNIDALKAIEQSILMLLNTERYANIIYSWEYGASLEKYIGTSYDFIVGDIGREIKESLLKDNRILDVNNFEFEKNGDEIYINFVVDTIYGTTKQGVKLNANKNIWTNL